MTRPARNVSRLTILGVALILSATALQGAGSMATSDNLLTIEPATTWAGVARVHLEIEDLRQNGELLEGIYRIRVPLSPKRNDIGRIVLRTSTPVAGLGHASATAAGSAVSSTGQVHEVVARMQPDGVVRIRVVTPRRTLQFTSRYVSR